MKHLKRFNESQDSKRDALCEEIRPYYDVLKMLKDADVAPFNLFFFQVTNDSSTLICHSQKLKGTKGDRFEIYLDGSVMICINNNTEMELSHDPTVTNINEMFSCLVFELHFYQSSNHSLTKHYLPELWKKLISLDDSYCLLCPEKWLKMLKPKIHNIAKLGILDQ